MDYNKVFNKLRENSGDICDETIRILLKIANNILKDPTNLKWRTLQKGNQAINNKIVLSKGGVDCLKLMGFQEVSPEKILFFSQYLSNLSL